MKIFVEGVGVLGPGLNGWQTSLSVLAGTAPYLEAELIIPPNDLLPSAERRRTGLPVRIALAVGCEAIANAQRNASELPAVFASSAADGENMHNIFETLAANGCQVSPTRFHNSVHNAPSGYWSIATKSMAASTSLACYDASFAAGLIEAATQVCAHQKVHEKAVVLIAYDTPYPQPLHAARPIGTSFGVSLVLGNKQTLGSLGALEINILRNRTASTSIADARLEALRVGTPAARSLPLLAAIAARAPSKIYLDYLGGNQLEVLLRPC